MNSEAHTKGIYQQIDSRRAILFLPIFLCGLILWGDYCMIESAPPYGPVNFFCFRENIKVLFKKPLYIFSRSHFSVGQRWVCRIRTFGWHTSLLRSSLIKVVTSIGGKVCFDNQCYVVAMNDNIYIKISLKIHNLYR